MNTLAIIENYYKKGSDLYDILIQHSADVMNKAVSMAEAHPELDVDIQFVKEAAMLHDIGIFLTNAPSIKCFGTAPYVCHGYLGHDLLLKLGYPKHALVCERHTGVGISLDEILKTDMPLPHRDMRPVSIEEQLICFADCFFSKTQIGEERSPEKVKHSLSKFGKDSVRQFEKWCALFL
ncbi:HDIG domain-containing protein [Dysgonomonas sp. Marseille-P4677]|uniref:HD domain-containing protein n=1 Tax=Dysgonomonas sp. Marseille-P4677 TaxID=2364790 RepID=UPI0019122F0A|nr:HD domain-containing protein [Dysgonomonas sp. Marseille-P4677]MBK5719246.1 HDIG domain-containing protein [Dysgonomonas sp. Marseille-P4677]